MMQYSILDRRPEEEALPLLHKHGIGVVTRGPVAKGLLSDKMLEKISEKGYLDYSANELRTILPSLRERFASLRPFTEIGLQYNLANPAVASVVTGVSSPEQVKSNAAAVKSNPLTNEEIALIKELTKANVYMEHR
jgi:aryl-alcohol dehydrogenase-like predicted oxidoreductase